MNRAWYLQVAVWYRGVMLDGTSLLATHYTSFKVQLQAHNELLDSGCAPCAL